MAASLGELIDGTIGTYFAGDVIDGQLGRITSIVGECRHRGDRTAVERLLRTVHDHLLAPEYSNGHQTDASNMVAIGVMMQCLEPIACLASHSAECYRLSEALVMHFARSSAREAGILLLACFGRLVGVESRQWEAADSIILAALPECLQSTTQQKRQFFTDALAVVEDEAWSALDGVASAARSNSSNASSGAGSRQAQPEGSSVTPSLAADLQHFTQRMGEAVSHTADASEAGVLQHRVAEFAVTLLGHCLLLSTATASRSTAPMATEAAPASLAALLRPQLLLDVAASQLQVLSAFGIPDVAMILALPAAPDAADREKQAVSVGSALAALAALCLPEGSNLHKPSGADEQLMLAMQGAEVLLTAAAEQQSESCGLAALSLLSGASAAVRATGQLAGDAVLDGVLHIAQLLVQTMVGHPAAGVRSAGFHALEDLLLALQPDVQLAALLQLLSCPVPSVTALLLHSVKQHFAAHWPPDGAALAAVLQLLPAVDSQPDTDISMAELHSFLEASETASAAANLIVFLLLKATPEDELPQRMDALAGGPCVSRTLRPLQTHVQRCMALLGPPAAAPDSGVSNGSAAAVANGVAPVHPSGEDLDAMLSLTRLLHAIERVLEILDG